MRMCQSHWDKIKSLIEESGLSSFIAKSGKDAINNMVGQFEGKETPPDPLMMANNMILSRSIESFGLGIMYGENCPICHANDPNNYPFRDGEPTGDYWIRTLIPHIKNMFEERGLLNKN